MAGGNVSVGRSAPQAVHSLTHLLGIEMCGRVMSLIFFASGFFCAEGSIERA